MQILHLHTCLTINIPALCILIQMNSGTVLNGYVKALIPSQPSCSTKWSQYAVSELPSDATAGGIRPGVCNLLITCMPLEFCVACTGHDMRGHSAFYEYVDNSPPRIMPGALALAQWSQLPPWGQTGRGPQPPSLEAL